MDLRRDIYEKLLKWKQEDTGRVLELQGARQVGKTYILKKFADENFKQVIYINMAEPSGEDFLRCLFRARDWQIGEKRPKHPLQQAVKLYEPDFSDNKDTVIIIDEIQESVETFNQIRTFARDFTCYVIVTGSYLGKTIQEGFFLPAGDLDRMTMETLTFREFLEVFGERRLYSEIDLFGSSKLEDYQKLHEYYGIYQKIGGYPAVVAAYARYQNMDKCFEIIEDLLDVFINESKRYFGDIKDINIFEKLFNAIALLMLKEKKGVRDLTAELSKIAYQSDSGRMTKKMINYAISWLQESHIIGYASKSIDADYKEIKDNCRYYFMDMGIAYRFLKLTGATFNEIKGILAENFVYLTLRRRNERKNEIAGIAPWFAVYEKTQGELDFFVRSLRDYKNYGIEVKSTEEEYKTGKAMLSDRKLDYLYLLRGDTQGGISKEGKQLTVPLCLADRISFNLSEN